MEQALGTARQAALRRPPPSPRWPKAARTAAAACVLAITAAVTGCAQQANAAAPIQVGTAYVTLPAASGSTQAYLIIQNNGSADRVTSARTSVGGLVTFRGPAGHGGSVLRTVPDIVVPARATVRLVPDGYHLLITGAHRMRAGTEITLTLVFARAGKMSVAALVTNPETGGSSYLGDLCAGWRDLTESASSAAWVVVHHIEIYRLDVGTGRSSGRPGGPHDNGT